MQGGLNAADIDAICADARQNPEANTKPIQSIVKHFGGEVEVTTGVKDEVGWGKGEEVILEKKQGRWRVVSVGPWIE